MNIDGIYAAGAFTNAGYPYFALYSAGAWQNAGLVMADACVAAATNGTTLAVGHGTGAMTGSSVGTTSIAYTGDKSASPVITITRTGTAATLQNVTNTLTGAALNFSYAMGAGEVITIDCTANPRMITSSSAGNIIGALLAGSKLQSFGVSPGTNNYIVQTSDGAQVSVSFTYRSAFWSVDSVGA